MRLAEKESHVQVKNRNKRRTNCYSLLTSSLAMCNFRFDTSRIPEIIEMSFNSACYICAACKEFLISFKIISPKPTIILITYLSNVNVNLYSLELCMTHRFLLGKKTNNNNKTWMCKNKILRKSKSNKHAGKPCSLGGDSIANLCVGWCTGFHFTSVPEVKLNYPTWTDSRHREAKCIRQCQKWALQHALLRHKTHLLSKKSTCKCSCGRLQVFCLHEMSKRDKSCCAFCPHSRKVFDFSEFCLFFPRTQTASHEGKFFSLRLNHGFVLHAKLFSFPSQQFLHHKWRLPNYFMKFYFSHKPEKLMVPISRRLRWAGSTPGINKIWILSWI